MNGWKHRRPGSVSKAPDASREASARSVSSTYRPASILRTLDRRHRLAKAVQQHADLGRVAYELDAGVAPFARLVVAAGQHRRRLAVLVARLDDLVALLVQRRAHL